MDITQLAQLVTWLQEEQHRDRLEIERLTQRLDVFKKENVEQAAHLKDMERRLAQQNAQLAQAAQIETSLEKTKREVALAIQQHEKKLQQAEKDASVLRKTERDAVHKTLETMRRELEEITQLETLRSIPFLEDLARRNERNIQQLQTLDAELRHQQNRSAEALQLAEVERDRQMAVWRTQMQTQHQTIEQCTSQIAGLQQQHLSAAQVVQKIKQFEESLKKQQDHVAELQRLAEDRQKRELGDWQAENEKRWKEWETTFNRQLNDYRLQMEKLAERLEHAEALLSRVTTQLDALWQTQRSFAYHRVGEVQKWITDFEKTWDEYEKSKE